MEPLSCIRSNFGLDMRDVRRSSNPDTSPGRKSSETGNFPPTSSLPPASIVQVDGFNVNSNGACRGRTVCDGPRATAIKVGIHKVVDGRVCGGWRLGL